MNRRTLIYLFILFFFNFFCFISLIIFSYFVSKNKPYKYKWNKLKNQQLNNFEERSQTATFTSYFLNQHQFDSNQQQDINKSNTKYNKAKSTYYEVKCSFWFFHLIASSSIIFYLLCI